jgi:hypothetical protein
MVLIKHGSGPLDLMLHKVIGRIPTRKGYKYHICKGGTMLGLEMDPRHPKAKGGPPIIIIIIFDQFKLFFRIFLIKLRRDPLDLMLHKALERIPTRDGYKYHIRRGRTKLGLRGTLDTPPPPQKKKTLKFNF